MKIAPPLLTLLFIATLQPSVSGAAEASRDDGQAQAPLFEEIAAVDGKVFDAFNHCADAGRLDEHASYFSPDVEFYHDTGGVTWTRDEMIANTRKYVCGNFTRELVPGSLKVYPLKEFGALSQGVHRFCQRATGKCGGAADFVIVWRRQGDQWQATRVLSYGHRAAVDAR